ncbi:MAG TPA: hypothetical protein VGN52_00315 [Burkholderiales bacterium]|jgi:ElaB/YqjD/DUF883 family membrane-anchored ribosome-binding protein
MDTELDILPPADSSLGDPSTLDRTAARAHAAIDTAAGIAKPKIDDAAATAHQAISKAEDSVAPAMQWVNVKVQQACDARDEALDGARETVRRQPLKAVGIAVLAGFALGKLI